MDAPRFQPNARKSGREKHRRYLARRRHRERMAAVCEELHQTVEAYQATGPNEGRRASDGCRGPPHVQKRLGPRHSGDYGDTPLNETSWHARYTQKTLGDPYRIDRWVRGMWWADDSKGQVERDFHEEIERKLAGAERLYWWALSADRSDRALAAVAALRRKTLPAELIRLIVPLALGPSPY
jgi:hypothetical protein